MKVRFMKKIGVTILIANGNLKNCVSALSMLASGHRKIKLESFLEDSDRHQRNPLSRIGELFGTHPYITNRIKKIQRFSKLINLKC